MDFCWGNLFRSHFRCYVIVQKLDFLGCYCTRRRNHKNILSDYVKGVIDNTSAFTRPERFSFHTCRRFAADKILNYMVN